MKVLYMFLYLSRWVSNPALEVHLCRFPPAHGANVVLLAQWNYISRPWSVLTERARPSTREDINPFFRVSVHFFYILDWFFLFNDNSEDQRRFGVYYLQK